MNELEKRIIHNIETFKLSNVFNTGSDDFREDLNKDILKLLKELVFTIDVLASIQQRREQAQTTLLNFFKKRDPKMLEAATIKVQRRFRGKKRQKEELKRIEQYYQDEMKASEKTAKQLMREASKPYVPQGCDKALAKRIVEAAYKI